MKKASLLFVMALLTAPLSARADINHRMTTSAALQVDAASTSVTRAGNTFSISGNNVTTTVTPSGGSAGASLGGISAMSNVGVATFTVPDATQTTAGNAFSFTTSLTTGDAIVTSAPLQVVQLLDIPTSMLLLLVLVPMEWLRLLVRTDLQLMVMETH